MNVEKRPLVKFELLITIRVTSTYTMTVCYRQGWRNTSKICKKILKTFYSLRCTSFPHFAALRSLKSHSARPTQTSPLSFKPPLQIYLSSSSIPSDHPLTRTPSPPSPLGRRQKTVTSSRTTRPASSDGPTCFSRSCRCLTLPPSPTSTP